MRTTHLICTIYYKELPSNSCKKLEMDSDAEVNEDMQKQLENLKQQWKQCAHDVEEVRAAQDKLATANEELDRKVKTLEAELQEKIFDEMVLEARVASLKAALQRERAAARAASRKLTEKLAELARALQKKFPQYFH